MCERTFERSTAVQLPDHVVADVEARLDHTQFDTVDEYVTSAVEALLQEVDDEPAARTTTDDADGETVDVDDDAVRDQLESLGYL